MLQSSPCHCLGWTVAVAELGPGHFPKEGPKESPGALHFLRTRLIAYAASLVAQPRRPHSPPVRPPPSHSTRTASAPAVQESMKSRTGRVWRVKEARTLERLERTIEWEQG